MDRNDELPPELEAALAALPREWDPPPGEEERTVRALRRRGLLPPPRWHRYTMYTGGVAAALTIFVAGSIYGSYRARGGGAATELDQPLPDARSAALLVQRAGSEYVGALVRFAAVSRTTPADPHLAGGREAATTTLCAAVAQFPRMAADRRPEFGPCDGAGAAGPPARRQIFWF